MKRLSSVLFCALLFVACNPVLGIEEATFGHEARRSEVCTSYCEEITANCTGANQQYLTKETCARMCGGFPINAESVGNTFDCRLKAAKDAKAENQAANCIKAGPFGEGGCNGFEQGHCEAFCTMTMRLCGDVHPYTDFNDCFNTCPSLLWNGRGALFTSDGKKLDEDKNTLDCRMTHLEIAFSKEESDWRKGHCAHTAKVSATCSK